MKLTSRQKTLLLHDGAVFVAALSATGIFDQLLGGGASLDACVGAVVLAAKVTLRKILPVPPAA